MELKKEFENYDSFIESAITLTKDTSQKLFATVYIGVARIISEIGNTRYDCDFEIPVYDLINNTKNVATTIKNVLSHHFKDNLTRYIRLNDRRANYFIFYDDYNNIDLIVNIEKIIIKKYIK